jgi:hypothetical protein
VLLENGVGEGGFEGQNFEGMMLNSLNGDGFEVDKSLFSCGDVTHPSLVLVTCPYEESKGSEPLNIHPLAVVEEQGVPYSMSSNWVVERVIFFVM